MISQKESTPPIYAYASRNSEIYLKLADLFPGFRQQSQHNIREITATYESKDLPWRRVILKLNYDEGAEDNQARIIDVVGEDWID